MSNTIKWYVTTQKSYNNMEVKEKENKLFYISDKHIIYKGSSLFNNPINMVQDLYYAEKIPGVIYINYNNLEGYIYNGAEWIKVIEGLKSSEMNRSETPIIKSRMLRSRSASISSATTVNEASFDDVENIRSVLAINAATTGLMPKVEKNRPDEVLISEADGTAKLSGYKIGVASFNTELGEQTIATEKAVNGYLKTSAINKSDIVTKESLNDNISEASDNRVISEAALVDMFTWREDMD